MASSKTGFWQNVKLFFIRTAIILFIFSVILVMFFRFVNIPLTPLMVIRTLQQKADGKESKMEKEWVSIDKISPNLINALIASEDNKFMTHYGFDFEAIGKAQKMNEKGRKLRGASTITQQTAKNVFCWPSRSYLRKGIEAYFTILIEAGWSKKRIMEVYLNIIEMGDGIYGAEMAAQIYFHKPASKLTKEEAALIAACVPGPRKFSPVKPSPYVTKKQRAILRVMRKMKKVEF